MPRYFHSEMANRPLISGATTVTFEPTGIFGGRLFGVVAVDEGPKLQLVLAAIAKKLGVSEITEGEYLKELERKKKIPSSTPSQASSQPAQRGPTLSEVVGVVSAERPVVPESSSTKILEPKDCVALGAVASPEPFIDEKDRLAPIKTKPRRKAA